MCCCCLTRTFGVLRVAAENGIRDPVADLQSQALSLRRDVSDLAAALLTADEREVAGVQTGAVVRVNEVDAGEAVIKVWLV